MDVHHNPDGASAQVAHQFDRSLEVVARVVDDGRSGQ
jgi:hypothetical protein